jgi:hypothetical protein
MQEYALVAAKEAMAWRDEEEKTFAAARVANESADAYLRLTVFYSLGLFLSGNATAFRRHRLKMAVLVSRITSGRTGDAMAMDQANESRPRKSGLWSCQAYRRGERQEIGQKLLPCHR